MKKKRKTKGKKGKPQENTLGFFWTRFTCRLPWLVQLLLSFLRFSSYHGLWHAPSSSFSSPSFLNFFSLFSLFFSMPLFIIVFFIFTSFSFKVAKVSFSMRFFLFLCDWTTSKLKGQKKFLKRKEIDKKKRERGTWFFNKNVEYRVNLKSTLLPCFWRRLDSSTGPPSSSYSGGVPTGFSVFFLSLLFPLFFVSFLHFSHNFSFSMPSLVSFFFFFLFLFFLHIFFPHYSSSNPRSKKSVASTRRRQKRWSQK